MTILRSLFLLFIPIVASCQLENRNPEIISKVRLLDEFVERFNDINSTFRTQFLEEFGVPCTLSHHQMVMSLFNTENHNIMKYDKEKFADFVCDSSSKYPLCMNDTNWYAETKANFLFKDNTSIHSTLYFQVNLAKENGSYWMISNITPPPLHYYESQDSSDCYHKEDSSNYIPPISNSTNFLWLKSLLIPHFCPEYFFEKKLLATKYGRVFANSIRDGKLKFQFIDTVIYHYTYLDTWAIDIRYFLRNGFNSGWLIDNIQHVNHTSVPNSILHNKAIKAVTRDDSLAIVDQSLYLLMKYKIYSNNLINEYMLGKAKKIKIVDTTLFVNDCKIEDNIYNNSDKKKLTVNDYFRVFSSRFYISDRDVLNIDKVELTDMYVGGDSIIARVRYCESYPSEFNKQLSPYKWWVAEISFHTNGKNLTGRISNIRSDHQ